MSKCYFCEKLNIYKEMAEGNKKFDFKYSVCLKVEKVRKEDNSIKGSIVNDGIGINYCPKCGKKIE